MTTFWRWSSEPCKGCGGNIASYLTLEPGEPWVGVIACKGSCGDSVVFGEGGPLSKPQDEHWHPVGDGSGSDPATHCYSADADACARFHRGEDPGLAANDA